MSLSNNFVCGSERVVQLPPPPFPQAKIPLLQIWYQRVVETYLGATHMRLGHCITNVTTDIAHAEIKRWKSFVTAMGKILRYKTLCPRPESHVYMFDETCSTEHRIEAARVMTLAGIRVFTFEFDHDTVYIIEYATRKRVFSRKHNL